MYYGAHKSLKINWLVVRTEFFARQPKPHPFFVLLCRPSTEKTHHRIKWEKNSAHRYILKCKQCSFELENKTHSNKNDDSQRENIL